MSPSACVSIWALPRKVKTRRVQRVSRYLYSGDTELDSELAGHGDSGLRTASNAL